MISSSEVWVSSKLAELANRIGISPVVAEINLSYQSPDGLSHQYTLSSADGVAETPEEEEKVLKLNELLGMKETGQRHFESLRDVEAAVDHALSLAPRARVR